LEFAKVWDSRRPLPNATTLGLGYFVVLRGDGYLKANPLFAEEAAGLRAPEDERR
jgi:hypothetical protein